MKNLADPINDRTIGEQMRDLGVPVKPKDAEEVTGVRWSTMPNARSTSVLMRLTKRGLYLTTKMADDIEWRAVFGSGVYRGQKVILIKHDPRGYKLSKSKARPCTANQKVLKELLAAGLAVGLYRPVKIKGGWMGLPVEAAK